MDPLPDPPAEVADSADAVIYGRVVSSTSYDVPGTLTDVKTLNTVLVKSTSRGDLHPGDEIVVVTGGGTTDDRNTTFSHEAHLTPDAVGRFYLSRVAPGTDVYAEEGVPTPLPAGSVFVVTGGHYGFQAQRSALASTSCPRAEETPGNGYCTTNPWAPWDPKSPIKYYINTTTTRLTADKVVLAIQSALAAWNDEPSAYARFEYQGTTTSQGTDGKSVFYFNEPCPFTALDRGSTQATKGTGNRLYHFKTCFREGITWSVQTLMHTALHESGHALGADHVSDPVQIMNPSPNDQVFLSWGDRNFVNAFYRGPQIPTRGDFNGDGAPDLISFENQATSSSSAVRVSLKDKSINAFTTATTWKTTFAPTSETPMVGNFDGDTGHKDDIVSFGRQDSGLVTVCLSNGTTAFSTCGTWYNGWGFHSVHPEVGDVNHDGKDDIIAFSTDDTGRVWVSLSDGGKFLAPTIWISGFGMGGETMGMGDVNHDGCADAVTIRNGSGSAMSKDVMVALSQACNVTNKQNKFGTPQLWLSNFCGPNRTPSVAYGKLHCVSHDGTSWLLSTVKTTNNGFNTPLEYGGAGGPVYNQTSLAYEYIYGYLVWFEHGSRAHVYARATGLPPAQAFDYLAPGPCPWNGVSGVCP